MVYCLYSEYGLNISIKSSSWLLHIYWTNQNERVTRIVKFYYTWVLNRLFCCEKKPLVTLLFFDNYVHVCPKLPLFILSIFSDIEPSFGVWVYLSNIMIKCELHIYFSAEYMTSELIKNIIFFKRSFFSSPMIIDRLIKDDFKKSCRKYYHKGSHTSSF